MFKKYMHIERFGNDEVQGIELGTAHIFPKLDGTNASIWTEYGEIKAGSRNRELSLDNDNAGFLAFVKDNAKLINFLRAHPAWRLFGEWLVPHSLKTYDESAWKKFYIFDVFSTLNDKYVSYDMYKPLLDEYELDYIPCMSIIKNAVYDNLLVEVKNNNFLIRDGEGSGEGIVIKNYDYQNRFGRTVFAKIITNAFKEKHQKTKGAIQKDLPMIEQQIIDKWVDSHFVNKVYAKIVNESDGWNSKYIPRLFDTVYYDLVNEDLWNIVKKMKNPTINFRTIYSLIIIKIKQIKPELF